jgi:hypothetical protein
MPNNNLYTLSYFRKRLKENDIKSVKLVNKFSDDDTRYWTILISPSFRNLICTCYKFPDGNFHFSIQTKNYTNYEIKTKSMEVIVKTVSLLIEEKEMP